MEIIFRFGWPGVRGPGKSWFVAIGRLVSIVLAGLSFSLCFCPVRPVFAAENELPSFKVAKSVLSRDDFVDHYLDSYERQRIAAAMCAPDSFLLQCTGSLTRAYIPAGNGKKLSQDYCKEYFGDRLEQVLRHDKEKTGYFYKELPVKISIDKARLLRKRLVKDIHGSLLSLLRDQGAAIGQDEKCVYRFLYSIEQVDSMGVAAD
ncbi:MAG: hypothetical protein KKB30_03175 [Proteobacteria bacterium]|nr:hypothetical protein [Pseudomonadota bacterium]MBU1716104.1 hypothetical protein [Pseudomonadota bacterium]